MSLSDKYQNGMIEFPKSSGFYYKINEEKDTCDIITPSSEPEYFIKFYGINENSVDSLINSYLYGSHPDQLNDPFDSSKFLIKINKDQPNEYWEFFFSKIGIISLCDYENHLNTLMWAHYGNHEGFAIKLNKKELCFTYHGPYPMNYMPEIPPEIKSLPTHLTTWIYITSKQKDWMYEMEWRFIPYFEDQIMESPNLNKGQFSDIEFIERKFSYDKSAISEIILGYKFIMNEECYFFDRATNSIIFKTNSLLKLKLLNYLLQNDLTKISLIDINPDNLLKFELRKKNVKLINETGNTFRISFLD